MGAPLADALQAEGVAAVAEDAEAVARSYHAAHSNETRGTRQGKAKDEERNNQGRAKDEERNREGYVHICAQNMDPRDMIDQIR